MTQTADNTATEPAPAEPANVKRYLDLSTGHLSEGEALVVLDRSGTSPVIRTAHAYGAWVHVANIEDMCIEELAEYEIELEDYPALRACIVKARELGCTWINFDSDADRINGLPTHDW